MKKIALLFFTIGIIQVAFSQMLPIPDDYLIQTSHDIVQGKVISTEAKWVNNGKFIYTFTKIQVDNVFSGNCRKGEIVTVVNPGGHDPVKDMGMIVSHQATFTINEEVVVFLVNAEGEVNTIDYSFLENDPNTPENIKRVNG